MKTLTDVLIGHRFRRTHATRMDRKRPIKFEFGNWDFLVTLNVILKNFTYIIDTYNFIVSSAIVSPI